MSVSAHVCVAPPPTMSCPPAAQMDPTHANSNRPDLTKTAVGAREPVQVPEMPGCLEVFPTRRLRGNSFPAASHKDGPRSWCAPSRVPAFRRGRLSRICGPLPSLRSAALPTLPCLRSPREVPLCRPAGYSPGVGLDIAHVFCFVNPAGDWAARAERAGLVLDDPDILMGREPDIPTM